MPPVLPPPEPPLPAAGAPETGLAAAAARSVAIQDTLQNLLAEYAINIYIYINIYFHNTYKYK